MATQYPKSYGPLFYLIAYAMRAFLYDGFLVSQEPKKRGGLGGENLPICNESAVSKY
jgi:hypothetical protein